MNIKTERKAVVAVSDPALRLWCFKVLSQDDCFDVVVTTDNGHVCVSAAAYYAPVLVVLGLDLYGLSGVDVLQELKQLPTPPKCVVLSQYTALAEEVLGAGADHCLALPCTARALLRCADALMPFQSTSPR